MCLFLLQELVTYKDLKILENLLERTENLTDVIHLRAAASGYNLTEDDKKLLSSTYLDLDDILKEVAAFINIKFPGCERHVRAWNNIDFDTKIGNFKITTTDREHIKREWYKGMFDLKSLIKILMNETLLLIEDTEEDRILPLIEPVINNFNGNIIYNNDSNTGNQSILGIGKKNERRSWLEIFSWIAGIIGAMIALYTLLN